MTIEERQEAAKWFQNRASHTTMPGAKMMFKRAAEALSEGMQPHWIPCSERLPKIEETGVSMMVLLCWSDGQVTVGAYAGGRTFVGQAWPKAKGANVRVIAWMPLPESYGGESDEMQ